MINSADKDISTWFNPDMDRRTFLKVSATLASSGAVASVFTRESEAQDVFAQQVITGENPPDPIETHEDIIYSVCQMCHSRCGIRAKVIEGVLLKLDGNPYHPNNRDVDEFNQADRLPYATAPQQAANDLGRLCLKGQSGVQTVYDPYRVQHPMKRVGPRNSGQWETITWDQAYSEIAERINELIPPQERDQLIDPDRPELGPKRNQLAFSPGRSVEKEMSGRIWKHAWGTANYGLSHTSVCEVSRHVANELITWDPKGGATSKGSGRSIGWQPDILGSEYIIFFGANPLEADFPMVGMARNLMQFKRNGGRYVCVDPRFNNTAAQAHQWVPIEPGTDAALAMGMIQWIIENQSYDQGYLRNTHQEAATAQGEPTWTDSSYLVGTFEDNGQSYQRYLTAKDFGLSGPGILDEDNVVLSDGEPRSYRQVSQGELEVARDMMVVDAQGNEQALLVKTAFSLLKEEAFSRSRAEYAAICDVDVAVLEQLAQEFVSHGKKAVAMTYRGPIKHTNGLYNQLAIQHLNTLIGNYDWKGGCMGGGGGWGHGGGIVSLSKVSGDPGSQGVRIDRAKTFYNAQETPNLFSGYPAARPWFPFGTHGNYQEIVPSIQDQYPYPLKVLITYWNALPYSTPALRNVWEQTIADENKLPLLVAISPVIGEVAAWADYILPDTVYLEKFSFPGIPWRVNKGTSFQRPVVGSFDGKPIGVRPSAGGVGNAIPVDARNDYTPVLPDTKAVLDIQIGLAKALGLPGVGDNSLLNGNGQAVGHLHNSWDWAKAMLQNLAHNSQGKYPGLSIEDIISKGGVFDNQGEEYSGEQLSYQYGNIIRTFIDPVAQTRDSVTGQFYSGVPRYLSEAHSDGSPVEDPDYPTRLITYKTVHHGQARTNVNPWLMLMVPENFVEISAVDATTLGIESGDKVRVSSHSNPDGIVGKARVTQGLKPGLVAISHHYGHWEQHARQHTIDGVPADYDPSRGAGIQPTLIMRRDKLYQNVSLQEPIGASCSFYDTWVKVVKV